MKNSIITIILMAFVSCSSSQVNVTQESINAFSFKLFEQIYAKNENCFYSPYSIYGALSMVYTGAKDGTKTDFERTLEIKNGEAFINDFKSITSDILLDREIEFVSSNSIWLQKDLKPEKDYSKSVEENFQAKSKNVEFQRANDREKTRQEINSWVEKQTRNNITNFIKPGVLSESTTMLLINAVYFKAMWQTEFSSKDTKDEKFLAASGDSVACRMMNTGLKTHYFEDELAQVLEIPYQNSKASMIVILPKDSSTADIKKFNYSYLSNVYRSFSLRQVKLSLPGFKMDVDYELSDAFKKIGLKSAFEPGADFSGITGNKDLILNNILHKSVIEVSEKGTEASSTTAVIAMRTTSVPSKGPVIFRADHPFIFIIKDNSSNVILFMGYMAMPK